jgi:hypothetical protein
MVDFLEQLSIYRKQQVLNEKWKRGLDPTKKVYRLL